MDIDMDTGTSMGLGGKLTGHALYVGGATIHAELCITLLATNQT